MTQWKDEWKGDRNELRPTDSDDVLYAHTATAVDEIVKVVDAMQSRPVKGVFFLAIIDDDLVFIASGDGPQLYHEVMIALNSQDDAEIIEDV